MPPDPDHFLKEDQGNEVMLTYRWSDFKGKSQSFSFPISKKDIEEASGEFGYSETALASHLRGIEYRLQDSMNVDIARMTEKLIMSSRYPQFLLSAASIQKGVILNPKTPLLFKAEVQQHLKMINNKIARKRAVHLKNIKKILTAEMEDYLENRGLRLTNKTIGVNYSFCIKKNKPRLGRIMTLLREKNSRLSCMRFLELCLTFVQEIRYALPPFKQKGKHLFQFWVPPLVLSNNLGDCDSKVVTFASLWSNYKKNPMLVIRVPGHSLVGLSGVMPNGYTLNLHGIRYTLMEVSGPEKLPPGAIRPYSMNCIEAGQYRYEIVR